jgi:hypothetical protein
LSGHQTAGRCPGVGGSIHDELLYCLAGRNIPL